jgi:hypothetical protein
MEKMFKQIAKPVAAYTFSPPRQMIPGELKLFQRVAEKYGLCTPRLFSLITKSLLAKKRLIVLKPYLLNYQNNLYAYYYCGYV